MSKRIALSNFSTENTSLQVSLYQNAISLFEDEIENYLGENVLVTALNSGTAAIHIALQLLDVCKGDPIICQSFTYIATINPVMYLNDTPIFVDSEKDTWNMCPVRLEEAICSSIKSGNKPKAILFVHTYGMPAKMNEIIQVAKKYSIPLVEDAAEALGSEYDGQKCGTFGDFGVLSFNNNKIITTFGGGALVCKSKKMKEKAIFLATQARNNKTFYEHSKVGYNYRMNSLAASFGLNQFPFLQKYISGRRKMNQFYKNIFDDKPGVSVFTESTDLAFSNHWLTCILIDKKTSKVNCNDIKEAFVKNNIEYRPLWNPMHLQPLFTTNTFFGEEVSKQLFKYGLCLPSNVNYSTLELAKIKKVINDLFL